jgi:hypothetical protein
LPAPPPVPATVYRSAPARARWLYLAVAAFSLVSLVSLWLEAQQLAILDGVLAGERGALGRLAESTDRLWFPDLLYSVTFIVIAVTFLAWLSRAHGNLAAVGLSSTRTRRGVLGWWFVPIANLWQPYRVVAELARASAAERAAPRLLLYSWWGLWLVGGLAGPSLRTVLDPATYEGLRENLVRTIVADALTLGAGLALAAVVRWVSAQQEHRAAALAATPMRHPFVHDDRRSPWLVASGALLALALGGVVVTSSLTGGGPETPDGSTSGSVSVFDLEVGHCFSDRFDDIKWTLHLVDCAAPHSGQVYALFEHPAAPSDAYPGSVAIEDFAWEGCLERFDTFTGEAYDTSPLEIYYMTPDRLSWSGNDREIVCLVGHVDGRLLEGSARQSLRSPSPGLIGPRGSDLAA